MHDLSNEQFIQLKNVLDSFEKIVTSSTKYFSEEFINELVEKSRKLLEAIKPHFEKSECVVNSVKVLKHYPQSGKEFERWGDVIKQDIERNNNT